MARGDMSNFGLKLQNQNKKDIQNGEACQVY